MSESPKPPLGAAGVLVDAGITPSRLESGGITQVAGAASAIASEFALAAMPGAS